MLDAAGPEADGASLQQPHPCTVPSPFPCSRGGRAAWPSSTELGAGLHTRCCPMHPFFPPVWHFLSMSRQEHIHGTTLGHHSSGEVPRMSLLSLWEEASNASAPFTACIPHLSPLLPLLPSCIFQKGLQDLFLKLRSHPAPLMVTQPPPTTLQPQLCFRQSPQALAC